MGVSIRKNVKRPGGPRVPDAGGGRVACVVAEVPRLAAEGTLHAVGHAGVAAVEDLTEDEGQHLDELARNALLGSGRGEVLDRDRDVADLAAHRPGDFQDRLSEREEPGPGELVELPDVPIVGQRRDRDVGDVVGVDERLRRIPGRKRNLVALDLFLPVVLAEVLGEPGRAQDRQLRAGVAHGPLRTLGLFLAASGQQNETRTPLSTASSANKPSVSAAPGSASQ